MKHEISANRDGKGIQLNIAEPGPNEMLFGLFMTEKEAQKIVNVLSKVIRDMKVGKHASP